VFIFFILLWVCVFVIVMFGGFVSGGVFVLGVMLVYGSFCVLWNFVGCFGCWVGVFVDFFV
jgi:hypothetical protein